MKQLESLVREMGTGTITIRELSNDPKMKRPSLILLTPSEIEVKNEGHSDAIVIHHPAESFSIQFSDNVRKLYEALKEYYEHS